MLEWRVVLERLERFVKLCNSLVLELLQRLVMTAVFTLEHFIKRAVCDGEEIRVRIGKKCGCVYYTQ